VMMPSMTSWTSTSMLFTNNKSEHMQDQQRRTMMMIKVDLDEDDDETETPAQQKKQLTPEEQAKLKAKKAEERAAREIQKKENRQKMMERSKEQRQQKEEKEAKSKERMEKQLKEREKARRPSIFDPDYEGPDVYERSSGNDDLHQPAAEKKVKVKPNIKKPNNNKNFVN
ncbi:hypothetical protein SAMD00019534_093690, partial [Acytostelium subglobosum LB1]|uniref:hypothetical protein n=1 Tax=Acytostelium subglobosum LB1 TaxID=1410327 RepID=UPI000644F35F